MSSAGAYPKLPPELEREIFETSAFFHPECMPALLQVARRVKIWIEPQLYRVISTSALSMGGKRMFRHRDHGVLRKLIRSQPIHWREHVRHIHFVGYRNREAVQDILSVCNNTVNLAFGGSYSSLLPFLEKLPLQRLSGSFSVDKTDFSGPLFAQITHLDINIHEVWDDDDLPIGWDTCSGFALLPRLTHLSFSQEAIPSSVFEGALEHCKSLTVLVFVWPSRTARLSGDAAYLKLQRDDPRFVMLVVADRLDDWEFGARGGEDYWDTADKMVKARLAEGTMPPSSLKTEIHETLERVELCETRVKESLALPSQLTEVRQHLDALAEFLQSLQRLYNADTQ
ncbi:hypothetical protein B0H11DRAFT_2039198 [Mycena galericulata]|nr:hypothetical protein B0H11DRAFT_2039198 [Mycena galericulata]